MYSPDDFTCPICMYIMIQPVTMPCKHSLCMICYKQCVEKASLSCPICRLRISVWARRNSKGNTLIDRVMWETIQRRFPVEVKNRIEGKDDSTDDNWDSPSAIETKLRKFKELSEPGAIRQEYEAALAKLERQREEEAKKEEEASAALIRALQEEEEEELAKLAKQRNEHERLGRLEAEKIQEMNADHSGRRLRDVKTNKDSKKRCESASMKLESFYNSFRKSSNSAPPYSEFATTLSNGQEQNNNQGSKSTYSPYPYTCLSPSEKQKVNPSLPYEATIDETDEISPCLKEHSYTTASADRIDLTFADDSNEWTSILRDDVQQYIKVEPPDLEEDPLTDIRNDRVNHIFQPICSSLKTPPKKLPSGELVDPVLIRSIPRSLTSCFGEGTSAVSPSSSTCSSEIFPDQSSEFRSVCKDFRTNLRCGTDGLSASELSSNRHSIKEKSKGEFIDKMNLTRKIVYGSCKYKKHRPVSSNGTSSSHPIAQSSSLSSAQVPSSSSLKGRLCPTDTSEQTTESTLTTIIDNSSKNVNGVDNKTEHKEDYFITDDTKLIIPLESEVEPSFSINCDDSHDTDTRRKDVKISSHKPSVRKNVSKKMDPACSTSIRDWCLKGKRKADSPFHDNTNGSADETLLSEDADHLLALELQKLFDKQDKCGISVDRFRGSNNEYQFRKKRKLR